MTGAAHHRGESRQDFETPSDFIKAVEVAFGKINFDLAAEAHNAKANRYYSLEDDSLEQSWLHDTPNGPRSLRWLNPPFAHIRPWAAKCEHTRNSPGFRGRILLLTPAAVGSNWYRDHVHRKARVYFLNGRITFVGQKHAYPKDCMLSVFGVRPGFEIWTWKENRLWQPS